jgi:DNA invertase Pin-like site-specific DNA recombinase
MFAALAEFERSLIKERTEAGLAAARARGRKGGRPRSLSKEKRKLVCQLYKSKQHSIKEIMNLMNISKQTLYNIVAEEEKSHAAV